MTTHAEILAKASKQVAASYRRPPLLAVTSTIWIRADKVKAFKERTK